MNKAYNPKEIESKIRSKWQKDKIYQVDLKDESKPKYFGMDMFNYPSALGLHIGHAFSFTISDVISRFHRQNGYNTYLPVGWDSFGLPAENYAVKVGRKPQLTTIEAIENYRKNYIAMGFSRDWSKEISTCEPEYYKWNQWLFLKLNENGLVYQSSAMQWWCDNCQTVLANEQVTADDKCWRHDTIEYPEITKKEIKQWFFKVTDYADELLEAIDGLDWTESTKLAQKNWIGKSVGSEVDFKIEDSSDSVTVFTTRIDTIFGATFLVLAPEHPLIDKITTDEHRSRVIQYKKEAIKKTDVDRQAAKEKTGVFTGAYAINPANEERIPIWIADYVLTGYGTGAIMAVPAHDERDFDFAEKYQIKSVQVINNEDIDSDDGVLINSGEFTGLKSSEARISINKWLAEKGQAMEKTNFKMRDWSVSRQRYWGTPIPVINCKSCGPVMVPEKDLPVILPELEDFKPSGDGRSALARAVGWKEIKCPNCGGEAERETETMDTFVDSSWYMFRYLSPHDNEQAFDPDIAKRWFPVDFYDGADHATMHLLYSRFITRFFYKIGLSPNPEPFKKFLFHGKITAADGTMFSKSKGNGVDPLEIIESGYGADALRVYLMFAAPLDLWVKWNSEGVPGAYRFLTRVWNLSFEVISGLKNSTDGDESKNEGDTLLKAVHKTIKKVTADINNLKFNTAIAALMELVNLMHKEKSKNIGSKDWRFAIESLLQLLAPFAPHMSDVLWHELGNSGTIHVDNWPQYEEKMLKEDQLVMIVSINGKPRAEINVKEGSLNEDIEKIALNNDKIMELTKGKKIQRVVVVAGKIVNLVV
jgi:leucyl-tRNA synthetase